MRYSEAKQLVKLLKIVGWKKIKGDMVYKKTWKHGSLQYSQLLDFEIVKDTNVPLSYILQDFELKAAKAFSEIG